MTRILVAIPMKDPAAAKSRLADVCPPKGRAALALHLLGQTVRRLRKATEQGARFDLAFVTTSPAIETCAAYEDVPVITDLGIGLSAAAGSARAWAEAQRYEALCLLPGDLADPSAADLVTLLDAPRMDAATLCRSHDGGTNALLMPLPNWMRFHYGPASCDAHIRAAQRAGLAARELQLRSLSRDIDHAEDLNHLPAAAQPVWRLDLPDDRDPYTHGA